MTSLDFLTLSACRAMKREKSLPMPFSPRRCLKWTRSLAAQGGPYWKVASPAKYWIGIRSPMSYYTLITEVVEVFEHKKGSHLSDGVTR